MGFKFLFKKPFAIYICWVFFCFFVGYLHGFLMVFVFLVVIVVIYMGFKFFHRNRGYLCGCFVFFVFLLCICIGFKSFT